MEQNKQPLAAWERAERLGHAWLTFADNHNRRRYREARRKRSHSAIRISLEIDLLARLENGELQAIGIEAANDPGPVFIPKYFFSKTADINWDVESVANLGKIFHQVRVEGLREEADDEMPIYGGLVDPRQVDKEWEKAAEALARESPPSDESLAQGELNSEDETPPSKPEPSDEPLIRRERESEDKILLGRPTPEKLEGAFPQRRRPGRPSKEPEIERAVDVLLGRGIDLAGMTRPSAYAAVKECAANELISNIKIGFHNSVIQRCLFRRFGARR
jgi:hypothetical protein